MDSDDDIDNNVWNSDDNMNAQSSSEDEFEPTNDRIKRKRNNDNIYVYILSFYTH